MNEVVYLLKKNETAIAFVKRVVAGQSLLCSWELKGAIPCGQTASKANVQPTCWLNYE